MRRSFMIWTANDRRSTFRSSTREQQFPSYTGSKELQRRSVFSIKSSSGSTQQNDENSLHSEGENVKENEEEDFQEAVEKNEEENEGQGATPIVNVPRGNLEKDKATKTYQFECKQYDVFTDDENKNKKRCYVCRRFDEPSSEEEEEKWEERVKNSIKPMLQEQEKKRYLYYGSKDIVECRNEEQRGNYLLIQPPKKLTVKVVETESYQLQKLEDEAPVLIIERHLVPVISEVSLQGARDDEKGTQTELPK